MRVTQQAFNLRRVEADHGLPVDDRDRRGHPSEFLEFVQRGFVDRDVPFRERNLLLLKEPLQSLAEQSSRLRVDGDGLWHHVNPSSW